MKKPELIDFNLTEDLLALNKKQISLFEKALDEKANQRNSICMTISIISAIVTFIAILISYEFFIVLGVWDSFLLLFFGQWGFWWKNRSDVSETVKEETRSLFVDRELAKRISAYHNAVYEYNNKTRVKEHSLVKVVLLLPDIGSPGEFTEVSTSWCVFSNIWLSNPQSFPDIEIPENIDEAFTKYYYNLMEKQKDRVAKPKKGLNIKEPLNFYYPCSDMYGVLFGKNPGDIVTLKVGLPYKILEVINPEDE